LDAELVNRGLASDPEAAFRLVEEGRVLVDGAPALNPGRVIFSPQNITVSEVKVYPSRAGEKLAGALLRLEIDVSQRKCFDAGAGHGGFTRCLLDHGAASVVTADVSYGDLDWELRQDRRVNVFERVNVREGIPPSAGAGFDLVVADLSFISLTLVLDNLLEITDPTGELLLLVKPQFEAPRGSVGRGGIVDDPDIWRTAVSKVCDYLEGAGWGVLSVIPAVPRGAGGNQEFFVHSSREVSEDSIERIDAAIEEAS
jgi:23S rRNA (cytidine1920-2'-O)/16S rRNA (cytidine1409-2'-O)-methyltransferase